MKRVLAIIYVCATGVPTAFAEEAPAAPANSQTSSVKELRRQCATDARAKGLKGAALQTAALDCLQQARPELASGIECRKQGVARNLSGAALRDFVRKCRRDKASEGASPAPEPAAR